MFVTYTFVICSIKITYLLTLGTCESDISVRIEYRIESEVVVYMFNADCHVGVVYLMMCKPTTLLHVTLYVLFFLSVIYVYVSITC